MPKLSVCSLLVSILVFGCSRTVDVNPPVNEKPAVPTATPEAETTTPFDPAAAEPATE